MKAIVWTKYGPPVVLQIKEVEKPIPEDNEVLVKIHATTVTAGDSELRDLKLPFYVSLPMRLWIGFRKPKGNTIPGTELAGEIETVGKDVRESMVAPGLNHPYRPSSSKYLLQMLRHCWLAETSTFRLHHSGLRMNCCLC